MNTAAPHLAPLFRSDTQGEILARILLNPDRAFSIAEIARDTGASYASAHREIQRLIRVGVITESKVGRASQVAADTSSPAYPPLTELLIQSYGPSSVIPTALAGIDGIEQAFIYGSWAARRGGEPGSPPQDVDVLVVGNPARSAIHDAAEKAEKVLGREVNIRVVSRATWAAAADPFIQTVKERPLTELVLKPGSSE